MAFETTTDDVIAGVDLSGRTALVTGASAGLGVETVRALQAAGAEVVGAVRSPAKASGRVACDLVELDLGSLESVRRGAAAAAERLPRIDLLVNNAGVMACPLDRTADGFELQLGTNHLGHFAWTTALLGNLAADARIINVSSRGHFITGMLWDDPHFRDESTYDKWKAYGQSKTANILFTTGLAARGYTSYALHPGMIHTELGRHLTSDDTAGLRRRAQVRTRRSPRAPPRRSSAAWPTASRTAPTSRTRRWPDRSTRTSAPA